VTAISSLKWKPMVCEGQIGSYGNEDVGYFAFIHKGVYKTRVDDNPKMTWKAAWDKASAAAEILNNLETIGNP
jgi:hypothetical protein